MAFDDVSVNIGVRARTEELKRLVQEFREGKASVEELRQATQRLKDTTVDQNSAILTLNRANRVQNFELINTLRLFRATQSMVASMNSVFQTFLLRQIAINQRAAEQRQAFESVSKVFTNFADNLKTLGPKSIDVINQLDNVNSSAKGLGSEGIAKLIEDMVKLRGEFADGSEEAELLDKAIADLREQMKGAKEKEFGEFVTETSSMVFGIATAVGAVGTFALTLQRHAGRVTLFSRAIHGLSAAMVALRTATLSAALAVVGLAVLPALPFLLEFILHPEKIEESQRNIESLLRGEVPSGPSGPSLFPQFPQAGGEEAAMPRSRFEGSSRLRSEVNKIEVNMNNTTIAGNMDIVKIFEEIWRRFLERLGERRR